MEEDVEILNHEIEECVQFLSAKAEELGRAHNQLMASKGRVLSPNAFKASYAWKAVQIIRQLQAEVEELKIKKNR